VNLSKEQTETISDILHRIGRCGYSYRPWDPDIFQTTIVGYAGTGKTTLIAELRKRLAADFPKISVAFLTFTGKASSVLRNKLVDAGAHYENDYIGTIHGLIYKAETRWDDTLKCHVIVDWTRKDRDDVWHHIFIIDEASMVSKEIWRDLCYYEKTTISVGDTGQLPPVGSAFNLLENPEYKLTEIHRQALNSPIIKLSKFIREEGYVPENTFFSKEVFSLDWRSKPAQKIWNSVNFDDDLIALCAFNTTRANLNDQIREKLGFKEAVPYPGEKIVCLQNNHNIKIMNGQIGKLLWVMPADKGLVRMTVEIDNEVYECMVSKKCFGEVTYTMHDKTKRLKQQRDYANEEGFHNVDFFDYGYSISVHKSQGSEWEKVVVFQQRTKRWDDDYFAKWLYTAVTRAREKLFIITNAWI